MRSPRLISLLARWFRAGDVHGAGSLSETGSTDTEASSTAGMPLRQVLLDGGDRGVLAGLVSVAHRHPQRSLIRDGGSGAPSPVLPRSQFGGRPPLPNPSAARFPNELSCLRVLPPTVTRVHNAQFDRVWNLGRKNADVGFRGQFSRMAV
jgi:hypothetical protein